MEIWYVSSENLPLALYLLLSHAIFAFSILTHTKESIKTECNQSSPKYPHPTDTLRKQNAKVPMPFSWWFSWRKYLSQKFFLRIFRLHIHVDKEYTCWHRVHYMYMHYIHNIMFVSFYLHFCAYFNQVILHLNFQQDQRFIHITKLPDKMGTQHSDFKSASKI